MSCLNHTHISFNDSASNYGHHGVWRTPCKHFWEEQPIHALFSFLVTTDLSRCLSGAVSNPGHIFRLSEHTHQIERRG